MELKQAGDFYRKNARCKKCVIAAAKVRVLANHSAYKAWHRKYRDDPKNKQRIKEAKARWYNRVRGTDEHKSKAREVTRRFNANHPERAWHKKYPQRALASARRRQAGLKTATPRWANIFFMQEIYDLAARRTRLLGVKHHVDHIIPLKHELVCGLHVENNLRVIHASENIKKSNKHWPGMS